MLIDANHLKLTLSGRPILRDVSLHLNRGEICGLLGPDGAGKSTTIAVLLDLYRADTGTLTLFDTPPETDSLAMRRRIGVMPERAGFYEGMSGPGYLRWYTGLFGGVRQSAEDLLRRVGLGELTEKPIGQFTGAMRTRLALARALVQAPELLILDEPTSGLDSRGRREIHDLLLDLTHEQGIAILLSTHISDDIDRLCDRASILERGRTVLEGTRAELVAREAAGQGYWLRMKDIPKGGTLPAGITIGECKGEWWHLSIDPSCRTPLPDLWVSLLAKGWRFSEIQPVGGSLETLYTRVTRQTAAYPRLAAA